jgi:hypothetical protein
MGEFWWGQVFKKLSPPPDISEIWMGIYDWVSDFEQDWIYEKLYPLPFSQTP